MDRASSRGRGVKTQEPSAQEKNRQGRDIKDPWSPQYKAYFELVARAHPLALCHLFY
jgi:hypothetical protein